MLYTANLDENNFVLSLAHTPHDNIDLDLSEVDMEYLNAYQLINNALILNQEKYDEIKAQEQEAAKQTEISELKKNLSDTDWIFSKELEEITSLSNPLTFVADVIKILVNYATVYKDTIAQRKVWRARIEELEK